MDNQAAAETLALMGDLIELAEDEPFKARAYHNAARTLKGLEVPARELLMQGRLGELPGFGRALVEKLGEYFHTGKITYLEELLAALPVGLLEMRKVPGLGAKKVKMLFREHRIHSIAILSRAAADGTLAKLPGFGAKTVAKIQAGIEQVQSFVGQWRLPRAERLAEAMATILAERYGAENVMVTGELRRHLEVITSLTWVVAGEPGGEELAAATAELRDCESAQLEGNRLVLRCADAIPGSVHFVPESEFGKTVLMTTGPEAYVAEILSRSTCTSGRESDWITAAGVSDLPPECRDLQSLWKSGAPDHLITHDDLRGVLHCHTDWSDGNASLEEMAEAARERGLTYIGICDHSQSAGYAGGLKAERVAAQHAEIERLNDSYGGSFRIFKGIESDIRVDGSLDYPEEVLKTFDFIVASVHSQLDMDEHTATDRICRALESPYTTMLGHPTGRLLLSRRGYPLDWARIIETAVANHVAIELNAHPSRLDIDWRHLGTLFAAGGMTSINPDAHLVRGIDFMRYGVGIARKAGTTPERVLNCLELDDIAEYFTDARP